MEDRHAWERPGAFEEAPGIWRIPLPLAGDHLKAVNVYAVLDGDRPVLIDGGWAAGDSADQLEAGLKIIGFTPRDVREYLVTHIHRDHYTLAVAMRREHGTKVSLGAGEELVLRAFGSLPEHPDVNTLRRAGAIALSDSFGSWTRDAAELSIYEDPDRWLADGDELPLANRTLRVVATPGHTRGHVVYHDAGHNVLFAGDHVLPHITPSISVEILHPPSPLRDFLRSLDIVRAFPDALLLPAHGPSRPSVHVRVDELVLHHERRLALMYAAVEKGADTAWEVARVITWTRREHQLESLDRFNQILAVLETAAHLTLLAEDGKLIATTIDGVVHYSAT